MPPATNGANGPTEWETLAVSVEHDPTAASRLAEAQRLATEAEVSPEIAFALLSRGFRADKAAIAAAGAGSHRRAIEDAIAAGTIPAAVAGEADVALAKLEQHALQQPDFLVQPEVLYASAIEAATGSSDAALLVNERLHAALRDRVREVVGTAGPALAGALAPKLAGLAWRDQADAPVRDLADRLLAELADDPVVADEAAAARQRLDGAPVEAVRDALHLDRALTDNPLLADDLDRGRAVQYARLAGLDDEATRAVLARSATFVEGTASVVEDLVADGVLAPEGATSLHRVLSLGALTADNVPLIRALDARGQTSPALLAGLRHDEWERLLEEHDVPTPAGDTRSTYAEALARNLETAFPTHALAARVDDPATRSLLERNPDLDLRFVDLATSDAPELDWADLADADRVAVTTRLKSYQRVMALSDRADVQAKLLGAGLDSAVRIASRTEADFIGASGLEVGEAKLTYARAQEAALSVSHGYAAIRDVIDGLFGDLSVGNVTPELVNDLRRIDGFSELFGPQDFCSCEQCRSVLSPAAYFCDLMYFVEQHVSNPVFVAPGQATHPLYLKRRRPDLWALKLTCGNTNELIPYLDIVNEVLESFLAGVIGGDVYATLADPAQKTSFHVPFSRPFTELHVYLSHFELSPADIYRTLQHADAKVWRALLGVSPDLATVIATADATGVLVRMGSPATLVDFPVKELLRITGLDRDQLDSVLELRSLPDLQSIAVGKQPVPGELQNFPEILKSLTADRVDVIHRFLRLWRATPWAIEELDLLLLALREAGLVGTDLDLAVIEQLGQLRELQTELKLKPEELCALAGSLPVSTDFPSQPEATADERLYERLFDLPALFGVANAGTGELQQSLVFHHSSLNTLDLTDTTVDPKTPLLLGGLGISETDLLVLLDLTKDVLPFDTGGNCTLDRAKLSLLYRHVRLARALKLTIDDFVGALELLFPVGGRVVKTFEQMRTLVDFRAWLRSCPFSVPELQFVLAGTESPSLKFANTSDTVAALVLEVQALGATGRVDLLRGKLAGLFNVTPDRLDDMAAWVTATITDPAVATALDATFTNGVPDNPPALQPVVVLVQQLERVNTLLTNLKLQDSSVAFLTGNPAALGITAVSALTLHDVQSLTFYRTLATRRDEVEPLVQQALLAHVASGTFAPGDDRARLADVFEVDASLIDSLVGVLPLSPTSIDAVSDLAEGLALCATLGVNGYSLQKLGDDASYAALATAAEVALGSFAAKYEDEDVREKKLEPYRDRLNVLKRDALCDYIVARQPELKFADRDEIYNFFLLDVEMSGCFRTSRVVSAISSVQLYVQRCLLNLEQSDPALNPAIPDVHVDPTMLPADEWDWRKNYRVWEANRKVFLYPESYLVPDLRDDTTPIFDDLANDLLQKKIDIDTASDAYRAYVTQFAELSHLRICGSYYHSATRTYYFFGRTQQDPPVFYYRTWDQTTWSPWRKMEVAIDAPYVAAEVHLGRLYVFWVSGKAKDKTSIQGGDSKLEYFTVNVDLNYSYLTPSGKWAPPQKLPWLYPSEKETISAVPRLFYEDDLLEMELSKTYRKVYPKTVGNKVLLRYYNAQLNGNYYFDRQLDLFHNKLKSGSGISDLKPKTAVILFATSNSARLGVEKYHHKTEVYFDRVLEQPENVATPHTNITEPFAHTTYNDTDPRRQDVMHYVANAYPESVFTFGDQQYLVHEKPRIWQGLRVVDDVNHALAVGALRSEALAVRSLSGDGHEGNGGTFGPMFTMSSALTQVTAASWLGSIIRPYVPVAKRELVRLSTSRADDLGEILLSDGLEQFFSLDTQRLTEKPLGITITDLAELAPPADDQSHLDFKGAFGGYYRELFLHIPWLVAYHLNANQRFEDALWWYSRIFDPTASESPEDKKPTDRNWRYAEFRNLSMPTLKKILTDAAAIAAYKSDPFNPFAIARLRPTAFQKAVVMHYVSNLLDWGDSLFAQDTMESINEATMLYVLAAQILGPRPQALGACETAPDHELTYETIGPAIAKGSEFLVTLENWTYATTWKFEVERQAKADTWNKLSKTVATAFTDVAEARVVREGVGVAARTTVDREPLVSLREELREEARRLADRYRAEIRPFATVAAERSIVEEARKAWEVEPPIRRWPGHQVVVQSTQAFCVPQNEELLKYWDRVEDRLYKIRNCMNISGVRRQLALFQPPINPMALVRARAAGLSLEEALAALAAPVPAYRFSYLVDRARQATSTVQSFGASLLSALEKKDLEELTLLRAVHERATQRLTKDIKTKQVEEAQFTLQASLASAANVQQRIAYYGGLIESGLTGWEITQQVTRHSATALRIAEAAVHMTAAITYLIPQVGSPFAMKYGGQELGHSGAEFAAWTQAMASILEAASASAGLEATFQRRAQEWRQQLTTADAELAQIRQQIQAAETRVAIAQRELDLHERTMEQTDEVYDLQKDKFTNLGLYNYLATTLTRLHREAYNAAHDLAAKAERAYRFETDDDTVFVAPDNWQFDRAGLLAGERLAMQLARLESSYLTKNTRRFEVTQSFSVAQVAPGALLDLRETGVCEFSLPEVLFDLAYPGQYKRLIKAVRVTIPCVAGPYTNVSAKLSLKQSHVRTQPTIDPADLVPMPVETTASIATSSAQNDGGMFELSFRDERYLPFEGAGAVSTWGLELPSQLRLFDYSTIGDVIIHVSYTALDDGALRTTVESQIVDELTQHASTVGMHRLFSLRHDLPGSFQQLLHGSGAGGQATTFELGAQHFPYFLAGRDLAVAGVTVYLRTASEDPVDTTGLSVTVNGGAAGAWSTPPRTTLRSADVGVSGPALKAWALNVTAGELKADEVADVLLLVKYTVT